jgi:hypothetical protein
MLRRHSKYSTMVQEDLCPLKDFHSFLIPFSQCGRQAHSEPCRYVSFLSGLVHVTLPNATGEAWVQGGKYGLIIAADNAAVSKYGHITTYPGDADTVVLQVPFKGGVLPNHTVLHPGPCTWPEMAGI